MLDLEESSHHVMILPNYEDDEISHLSDPTGIDYHHVPPSKPKGWRIGRRPPLLRKLKQALKKYPDPPMHDIPEPEHDSVQYVTVHKELVKGYYGTQPPPQTSQPQHLLPPLLLRREASESEPLLIFQSSDSSWKEEDDLESPNFQDALLQKANWNSPPQEQQTNPTTTRRKSLELGNRDSLEALTDRNSTPIQWHIGTILFMYGMLILMYVVQTSASSLWQETAPGMIVALSTFSLVVYLWKVSYRHQRYRCRRQGWRL